MEPQLLRSKRKLQLLYLLKKISFLAIILSVAVIIISIFTYIFNFCFPRVFPRLAEYHVVRPIDRRPYYYMRDLFLPTMVIPSALSIVIACSIQIVTRAKLNSLYPIPSEKWGVLNRPPIKPGGLKQIRGYHNLY